MSTHLTFYLIEYSSDIIDIHRIVNSKILVVVFGAIYM